MYANGCTIKEIKNHLDKNNIKNQNGKPWGINPLFCILKSKKCNGYYLYKGNEFKNAILKIINDELFEKVQARRNQGHIPSRGKAKVPYILFGKLICAECHRKLDGVSETRKLKRTYNYYSCLGVRKYHDCELQYFKKDELEDFVLTAVKKALTDELILEVSKQVYMILSNSSEKLIIKDLQRRISEIDKQTNNLINAIATGTNPKIINDRINSL